MRFLQITCCLPGIISTKVFFGVSYKSFLDAFGLHFGDRIHFYCVFLNNKILLVSKAITCRKIQLVFDLGKIIPWIRSAGIVIRSSLKGSIKFHKLLDIQRRKHGGIKKSLLTRVKFMKLDLAHCRCREVR